MSKKVIVTVALTGGMAVTKEEAPYLPMQPEEIANSAFECFKAGAAIAHIHARDKEGYPTGDPQVYSNIHELIRDKCNMIIQDTTGGGGNLDFNQRIACLDTNPEMASLNMGILFRTVGKYAGTYFSNTRPVIEQLAKEMKERGIKPEMEVFNHAMMSEVYNLISKKLVDPPYYINFVLGVRHQGGVPGTIDMLDSLKDMLPDNSVFNVTGISKVQMPMIVHSALVGGEVRVGMEDNIYYKKGELATSNVQFVERIVRVLRDLNLEPATPDEAREMLGLSK